jgi:TnpA family transposase
MASRLFSDDQLEALKGFPDIDKDELIRFFTLTPADVAFVDPERGRGPADRLGLAVQLCTLPWLGFVPDDVRAAPPVAVGRLAQRLRVDAAVLAGYGERPQTRTDHLRLVTDYLSWRPAGSDGVAVKELEDFLLVRAMEHDSPTTLFNLACEYLIAARTVRPGAVTLTQMVASARTTATALTHQKVAHLLTEQVMADLDLLLRFDVGLGMTRLAWLTAPAAEATASSVKTSIEKLKFLRAMNVHFADQGLSTYTHVSDQHSTFGTKVIVPTTREAHYVLDDFLGNATDLPIREHATDTHGVTLINFALFDLVGKALTPRIRDLGKITMCRDDTPSAVNARYPHAGPLLSTRLNADLIVDCWPDLLRMAGSLKFGEATASLIVGKWSAASRQNTLAAALKEWGTLRRTIHSAKYLSDPVYRRKIPAAQQGRVPARAAPRPALRQPGHHRQSPPGAADRAGVVPDRPDQCRGDVVDGVLLPRGGAAARPGPRHPGRGPDPHLPGAQREHQLLRRHHRRCRRRTRQARRAGPAATTPDGRGVDMTAPFGYVNPATR